MAAPLLSPHNRSTSAHHGRHSDQLLTLLANRDEVTWRQTVRQYEQLVSRSARSVLMNVADVEDVIQRTWVLLLRNATRINQTDRLSGWLATTARREALAIARRQRRETPKSDLNDLLGADDSDVATDVLREELNQKLHVAVESLPEKQRDLLRVMLREPLSYHAISLELGIPAGSIGPTRARAICSLRAALEVLA
jgi:RNA polymerase sigma factor (sigma-70 family)